ncbi:MAG: exodeoxyribonuclease III [Actinomycetota bacterium]|jgi:exodeoxyribonuclease-3|nr:exodeoxyribonuclease III [Actinomycetota bacterium]
MLTVATWNVNSLKARLDRVLSWLERAAPDVVCLQETKLTEAAFPAAAFAAAGYESVHFGQGQWNGVAILSKVGIVEPVRGLEDEPGGEARAVGATCGPLRVYSLYIPNGRSLDSDHYRYKLEWLGALAGTVRKELANQERLVLGGDFNIAFDDRDVWSPAAFEGATHVSLPEREALAGIYQLGMVDLFRAQHQEDGLFSWWDYRGGSFHKRQGMRIDLLIGSHAVANELSWAVIDRNERKGPGPSDHAPVLAGLEIE